MIGSEIAIFDRFVSPPAIDAICSVTFDRRLAFSPDLTSTLE